MINVIINGFFDQGLYEIIHELKKKLKVNYCLATYTTDEKKEFPEISSIAKDLLLWKDLILANYPIPLEKLPPLDSQIIESMTECETVVLKMMERFEYLKSYHGILSYDERKRLYLRHLRFWNYIINEKKINLYISSSVPHEVYDYIIYSLCKIKKIPTLFFFSIQIEGCLLLMDDWEKPIHNMPLRYKTLLAKYSSTNEDDIPLEKHLEYHYQMQTSSVKDPIPYFMDPNDPLYIKPSARLFRKKKSSFIKYLKNLFMSIIKGHVNFFHQVMGFEYWQKKIKMKIFDLKRSFLERQLINFYEKHSVSPNLQEKYIYVPLHYQPEATTSPFAGVYVNQILIVEMLASLVPKNVFIYVKEYPYQKIPGRSISFYKDLLKIGNVVLIKKDSSSFRLIENSQAVATATGTPGWESLWKGKPVLLFGHCFYEYAKGVFLIRTKEDCKNALNKIFNKSVTWSRKEMKIYLKALEGLTIPGYLGFFSRKKTYYQSDKENALQISKFLLEKIKNKTSDG